MQSSNLSDMSVSTQREVDKFTKLLTYALERKQKGFVKEYYQTLNGQDFLKANSEPRKLRLWVKVFLRSLSLIFDTYNDLEIVDLLLFKLPWLC